MPRFFEAGSPLLVGETICSSNACFSHLLLDIRFHKCAEDFQDRAGKGF